MALIVLICFIIDMFIWFLALVGVVPVEHANRASPWLAWIACILLGFVVFADSTFNT